MLTLPAPYAQAIRNSITVTYTIDASRGGSSVTGATGLSPVGGTITDTTAPGVRRVLNLDLAPALGLYDALTPTGTALTVTGKVTYGDRSTLTVPMGVFDVDSEKLTEGVGGLSLTAPDKWIRIKRARFIKPQASTKGMLVTAQIQALIRGALGSSEPVNVTATSQATVGAQVWEKDRDQAIIDLATGIGAWVFFDRYGVATIADIPSIGAEANWLIDASASGVLISLDRERSRTSTSNVVVVESSAASGAAFATQYVWDGDPSSGTYAGTDPVNHPELAGPFGVVPYFYDTPLPLTAAAAQATGGTILARTTGLASQVSLSSVPNPAIDAFDIIDVLPPGGPFLRTINPNGNGGGPPLWPASDLYPSDSLYPSSSGGGGTVRVASGGQPRTLERHMVDTVSHPLTQPSGGGGNPQTIQGRSTRTDAYTG